MAKNSCGKFLITLILRPFIWGHHVGQAHVHVRSDVTMDLTLNHSGPHSSQTAYRLCGDLMQNVCIQPTYSTTSLEKLWPGVLPQGSYAHLRTQCVLTCGTLLSSPSTSEVYIHCMKFVFTLACTKQLARREPSSCATTPLFSA